jgi:hypothetical protein
MGSGGYGRPERVDEGAGERVVQRDGRQGRRGMRRGEHEFAEPSGSVRSHRLLSWQLKPSRYARERRRSSKVVHVQ